MTVHIKFAKTDDKAIIPSKNIEDAGYDIYAIYDKDIVTLRPNQTIMLRTGIASAIDDGYYFQIQERGSTGSKALKYGAGVVDSGYRGEWFIPITNCGEKPACIYNDDKFSQEELEQMNDFDYIFYPQSKAICQAVLLPVPKTEIEVIPYSELKEIPSIRGTGALGSSKK